MYTSKFLVGIALFAIFATGWTPAQAAQTSELLAPDRIALAPADAHPNQRACCTTYREIIFRQYTANINPAGMQTITEIAAYLAENPRLQVRVYGSRYLTNGEPISQDLKQARNAAVRDALIQAGVPKYKILTGEFGDPDPQLVLVRPIDVLAQRRSQSTL
jgi:outer membrane protein OmpA-like peptidoglycan-associated protein